MERTEFTARIYGQPIPLARPFFTKGRAIDRQKDRKKSVISAIKKIMSDKKIELIDDVNAIVTVDMKFYFSSKKIGPRNKKPDIDNLVKFYLDCLSGVLFRDDAQVAKIIAEKLNAGSDINSLTHIRVTIN